MEEKENAPKDTAVIVVASYHDDFCTVKLFDATSLEPTELASATVLSKDGKGLSRAVTSAFENLERKV